MTTDESSHTDHPVRSPSLPPFLSERFSEGLEAGKMVGTVVMCAAALLLPWVAWRLLYSLWWRPMRIDRCLKKQGIRGPEGSFLLGSSREMMSMIHQAWSRPMNLSHDIAPRVIPSFHDVAKKYGKVSSVWFVNVPVLIIMSPELVKEVLANKLGQFEKTPPTPIMKLLITGLASYEGEKWAKHRRILNSAFHLEKLKGMMPAFSICCNRLIKKWEKLTAAHGSCELDVFVEFQNLTGDFISRTAFGSNFEEGKRIFQMQNEQAHIASRSFWKIQIPGVTFIPTKDNVRMKKLHDEVTAILKAVIEKRVKEMEAGDGNRDDLLGSLLESNKNAKDAESTWSSLKRTELSMEEIIEECRLFYFAGQETTALLLTWTLVVLSMHPDWQTRARDEVFQICGTGVPSFDNLNQFKTVTMILYEVLRLYPPGPIMSRQTYKRTKLGDLDLPAGIQLLLPTLLIHHEPEFWGADSHEFRPERFSEGVSNASKHPSVFFPFSGGPRFCIGQTYAMIEAKLTVAMILQRFSLELSPSYTHAPYFVVTLEPQHGAHIILHKL